MRAMMLFAALLSATTAVADEGEITIGLAGGAVFTDSLEPFDSGATFMPRVQIGLAHGLGIEADISMVRGVTRYQDQPYQMLTPRVNFFGSAMPDQDVQPFFTAGPGVFVKSMDEVAAEQQPQGFKNGDVDLLWNMGAGLLYNVTDSIDVRYDQRLMINFGTEDFQNHGDTFLNWESTLAVQFTFGGKDTDKDGITDGSDGCYDEAEDYDDFQDEDGCPDDDNDGDGVLDANEECDNEPEDEDGWQDEDGCPDLDNDEDGFADAEDLCPTDKGVASAQGCPDADGDSIMDSLDLCPAASGPKETAGCPDSDGDSVVDNEDECPETAGKPEALGCVDGDGDGVPDTRDACLDQAGDPEAWNLYASGCVANVYPVIGQLVFKQPITFEGSDVIAEESKPDLDIAAGLLTAHDDMVVKIAVHADKGEDAEKTLMDTKAQAASLKQYFLDKGVEGRRVGAKGVGDAEPPEGKTEPEARIVFELAFLVPDPAEAPAKDEAPADEPAKDEAPADEPAKDEAPADEPAKDEAPADEPAKDEAPAKEPAKDEAPAKEPAKDEAPAKEEGDAPE